MKTILVILLFVLIILIFEILTRIMMYKGSLKDKFIQWLEDDKDGRD